MKTPPHFVIDLLQKQPNIFTKRRVCRVETPSGESWCLKKFGPRESSLLWVLGAYCHLQEKGFEHLPALVYLENQRPYFYYQGDFFYLTRWLAGRPADFLRLDDVKTAGNLLARFHLASAGYTPPAEASERIAWGKLPMRLKSRWEEIKKFAALAQNRAANDSLARELSIFLPSAVREGEKVLENLKDSPYCKLVAEAQEWKGVCHQDFAAQNLLWHQGQLVVLDLDNCQADIPVRDVYRFLRRLFIEQPWEPAVAREALQAYASQRNLKPEEIEVLKLLLRFPHDLWRISFDWFREPTSRNREIQTKRLQRFAASRQGLETFLAQLP